MNRLLPAKADKPALMIDTFEPPLMKRLLLLALLLVLYVEGTPARADNWIFARSYYSHQPVTPVEIGRRPPGGPFYTRQQGEFVRSGFRNVRSSIVVGGYSYDHANIYESWIQVGGQY